MQEGGYLALHRVVEVREVFGGTCTLMQLFYLRPLRLLCVFFLVLLCIENYIDAVLEDLTNFDVDEVMVVQKPGIIAVVEVRLVTAPF